MLSQVFQSKRAAIVAVSLGFLAWGVGYGLIWVDYFKDVNTRYAERMQSGIAASDRNDFGKAEHDFNDAVKYAENSGNAAMTSKALCELAVVYAGQNRFEGAHDTLHRAMSIMHRAIEVSSDPIVKNSMQHHLMRAQMYLAKVLASAGKVDEAEGVLKKMVSEETLALVEVDPRAKELCLQFAEVLRKKGKGDAAMAIESRVKTPQYKGTDFQRDLEKCLSDIQYDRPFAAQLDLLIASAQGVDAQQRVAAQNMLAAALTVLIDQQIAQGKFTEASRNIDRVKKVMAGRKPYWQAMIAAATLAVRTKDQEKAIELYNRAINEMHQQGEKDSRSEAIASLLLGDLYVSRGWNQQAEQTYEHSLAIFSRIKGQTYDADTCLVLRLCTELTALRQRLKSSEAAILEALEPGLKTAKTIDGKESFDDTWILEKLANCCAAQKREKDFEVLVAQMTKARKRILPQSLEAAGALNLMGHVAMTHAQFTKADEFYKEAQSICEKQTDKNALASTLIQRGCMATKAGWNKEAERYFNRALDETKNEPNAELHKSAQSNLKILQSKSKH